MPELSEILERADRAVGSVPLPPAGFDGVRRSRERRQRNKRVRAGVLGAFVALAVALAAGRAWLLEPEPFDTPDPTPATERVGFVGLFEIQISVFTDGRVIWVRSGRETGVPEGAEERDTGYLTQVLTPEGVEMLRDEIYGTGFFGEGAAFRGGYAGPFEGDVGRFHGDSGLWLDVYDGRERPRTLSWYGGNEELFDGPPTPQERQTVGQLVDRLADPASWLPDTAWEQREIQAFVASTYFVMICCGSRDTSGLPAPADRLVSGEDYHCMTTDEARAIAAAFDAAGVPLKRPWFPGGITFDLWSLPDPWYSGDHVLSIYPRLNAEC
jgi:hypothetical protein